ncbi:MAG: hypothetical protein CVU55_10390 [Deltaproteobacteria bacterium HGW-Deltaproteobacteria-13]|jgi:pimeloyl-ACP methyl ester carboxylesterase|nr:MAG: hypothetical protein CVU55_10390 [Deltaproteobacteria bacterium HGW-Deltaproteobacteria-13]
MKNVTWFKRVRPECKSAFFTNLFIVMMVMVCGLVMAPGVSQASGVPLNAGGIYNTTADDGSKIFLYRYAPYTTETPKFRTSGTPVVIFTGICMNMNQYLSSTPSDMKDAYSGVYVPPVDSAPDWVLNWNKKDYEPYIKSDKMRYYSLAHYLWLQGFDPWLVNYRGTGRSPVKSTAANPNSITTLDTWATLDVPAAIAKVKSVTGKKMFIGGHSTGGLVAYNYLQGAYLDYGMINTAGAKKAYYQLNYALGIMPHVKASAALAKTRNADIKGFIGLDPAGVPALPALLDDPLIWTLVGTKLFLPLDNISDNLISLFPEKELVGLLEGVFGMLNSVAAGNSALNNFFDYLNFWVVEDMDPCLEDWTVRYSIGGASLRGFGHYMDMGLHNTLREHYLNGSENYLSKLFTGGSTPNPGRDGYYYFSENMSRMTVPLIVFSSSTGSLVSPEATYEFIISKKSPTAYDEWYVLGGTGHFDLAMGKRMPTTVFPQLGDWLKAVDALPGNPVNTSTPASRVDE